MKCDACKTEHQLDVSCDTKALIAQYLLFKKRMEDAILREFKGKTLDEANTQKLKGFMIGFMQGDPWFRAAILLGDDNANP